MRQYGSFISTILKKQQVERTNVLILHVKHMIKRL